MAVPESEALAKAEREVAALSLALAESGRKLAAQRLEAQHRIRNLLSMIRAMSSRSFELSSSLEDLAMHQSGRVSAIARVEAAVGSMLDGAGADLEQLLYEEWLAVVGVNEEGRTSASGPRVVLAPRTAERLGLAFHELTTNAIKFGAFCGRDGRVAVSWELTEELLTVTWVESGVSLIDTAPRRLGFGRDYLERALAYDLSATTRLDFSPGGLIASISLPRAGNLVAGDARGGDADSSLPA